MPSQLWGVNGTVGAAFPEGWPGSVLLALYGLALAFALYRLRHYFVRQSSRQTGVTVALCLLAFLFSQLFPIFLSETPEMVLTSLAAAPFLLAGVVLGPAAALLAGLCTGLGQALGQTHTWFDIFHYGAVALVASAMMRQQYEGRVYDWLRHPVAVGILSGASLTILTIWAAYVDGQDGSGYAAALDVALRAASSTFWPSLIEGLVGGGVVTVVLFQLPHLRPVRKPALPPWQRSVRQHLLSQFVLFAVILTVALVATVIGFAVRVSTKLVVNQMVHDTEIVSAEIPAFQHHLQNLLAEFEDTESLLEDDVVANEKALQQLHRNDSFFGRILLVNSDQTVSAFYPSEDVDGVSLSRLEKETVARAFLTKSSDIATADSTVGEQIVSFVVPVLDAEGSAEAVIIGRVPQLSLESLIIGLQGTVGQGKGFIVDENDQIIAHADSGRLLEEWHAPDNQGDAIPFSIGPETTGVAYRDYSERGARDLVYYRTVADHPWKIVTTVPYAVVLNLAVSIGGPLALALIVAMALFYARLAHVGHDIVRPISDLVDAARTIAAGGKWAPPANVQRSDEIGELSQAFGQMHRSANRRLKELALLLKVSHNVASNIDINQGMPAILRGVLRGTGASGARAVVFNPDDNNALAFGEGPSSGDMAALDRPILTRMRHSKELFLSTPAQIQAALEVDESDVPVPALFAIPLRFHDRFQGVLWLGYRQAHGFHPSVRTLLQTLAGQAAVLIENARLYAAAEGGRQRLSAVLTSTTDAVIVTDPLDRILLINPAMEDAFGLRASEVIGRPIVDVIELDSLVEALTNPGNEVCNLKISRGDDQEYYCTVDPIIINGGQPIGRVAVMHDISYLKKIDQMKFDFISAVTHDLLTPLTIMRGFAGMLSMVGEVNERQDEYVNKILKGIDQVKQIVDDLLELGRIEAGVAPSSDEIDVKLLLSDVLAEYRLHARVNGIKLQLEAGSALPLIKGDLNLIRRAIANLIANGVKYAPNSGPMLLKAERGTQEVIISVRDHGPGISQQELIRIFDKGYRVRQEGDESVKGVGLGLAIVKLVAEQHGGRAWCESQLGEGSTFFIALPVEPPQGTDQA